MFAETWCTVGYKRRCFIVCCIVCFIVFIDAGKGYLCPVYCERWQQGETTCEAFLHLTQWLKDLIPPSCWLLKKWKDKSRLFCWVLLHFCLVWSVFCESTKASYACLLFFHLMRKTGIIYMFICEFCLFSWLWTNLLERIPQINLKGAVIFGHAKWVCFSQ